MYVWKIIWLIIIFMGIYKYFYYKSKYDDSYNW